MVRQRVLIPSFVGSSPATPAIFKKNAKHLFGVFFVVEPVKQ
ncbi:hypothetical protein GARC_1760 [Paraglaciecola arctica BSs20135]|uniref:Uncharacterized protein n=1 Tax=Paraglaciecola arctica BSs20135 TaxID=493475 RepID=K6YKP2_9ALTE|nr:hypothetical protein GARC_1760 [Paraglaciecola arctica BSs20135]